MRKIVEVFGTVDKIDKNGKKYSLIMVKLDDGTECDIWDDQGRQMNVGDQVGVFYDEKWDRVKAWKPKSKEI